MKKIVFFIMSYHINELLSHSKLQVKHQGGDSGKITNDAFARTVAMKLVENEKEKCK